MTSPTLSEPHAFRTGHIGLNVSHIERSKRFYTDVFGFDVLRESLDSDKPFVFLADAGTPVLTLWQQSAGTFSPSTPGLHHLAFQVASIEDVQAAERRLERLGAAFAYDGIVAHGEGRGSGGIFFTDPDGIRLEIYAASGAESSPAPSGAAPT
jgi:lactoylglutathione lyase